MSRFAVTVTAVLMAAAPSGAAEGLGPRAPRNVLIIVADDLGVDYVGVYAEGSNPAPTPTIDALAANGVLFRNAYANPACSPSRADIMTGRYGFRTGIGFPVSASGWALDPAEETIPEVLDRFPHLGFSHAAIGKWHLGNSGVGGQLAPNVAGWSHYAGALGNITGNWTYFNYNRTVDGTTAISINYATTETVDDALAWIQSTPQPWVCYVAFNAPHNPFHAPPSHLHNVTLPAVDPRCEPVPFFRAAVEAMDTEIARLFSSLGSQMARTNVILVGDNGTPGEVAEPPFLPGHAKLTPYEGGVNVPLIISGPDVVQPGRAVSGIVNICDLFATTLDLAGIPMEDAYPPPAAIDHDAVSLLPYLHDPGQTPLRQFVYSNLFNPNDPRGIGRERDLQIMREKRYKLIRKKTQGSSAGIEFYDLETDPFETVNLLAAPMTPEERQAFSDLWARMSRIHPR